LKKSETSVYGLYFEKMSFCANRIDQEKKERKKERKKKEKKNLR